MSFKVLLVDDHALMRKGLRLLIDQADNDLQVVGEAESGETAIQLTEQLEPDIVIMDIGMPGLNGIEATQRILAARPQTRILALSIHGEKDFVDDMLAAGASGYLLKETAPEELMSAAYEVMRGEVYLSPAITKMVVSEYRTRVSEKDQAYISKIEMITGPIQKTKLYPPRSSSDQIARPRLLEHLNRESQEPVILVTAPAGYGKTVLVGQWMQSSAWRRAWISLDENDSQLGTFFGYLLLALYSLFPALNWRSMNIIVSPSLPSISMLAQSLTKDLEQIGEPFILVLDDIQHIQSREIWELLSLILRHPPHNLHLVLVGRHDPPSLDILLRSRNQAAEIRESELRFTTQETAQLMETMLNRQVDPAIAVDWAQNTEGWVTAIRLAILSLRHRSQDVDLRLPVGGDSRYLRDYLLAEVLAHLEPYTRAWLLRSAVLNRFCAPLIEAACRTESDHGDLTGEAFIDWLKLENLFLVPLDDQGEWFRFHHLFRQFLLEILQREVDPGEITELRMRVSHWFAENNLLDESLQYALAAGDMGYASSFVAQHRQQILDLENWKRLEEWLRIFPREVIASDPILSITKANLHSSFGPDRAFFTSQARRLLATLPADSPTSKEVQGELAAGDALMCILTDEADNAITKSIEALDYLPPQAYHYRGLAIGAQAMGYQMSGEFDQAIRIVGEGLSDPGYPQIPRTRLKLVRTFVCLMQGDLSSTQLFADECYRLAVKYNLWDTICEASYISGIAYYWRNELSVAELKLLSIVENPELANPIYLAHATCALTRIYQTRHQPEKAAEILSGVISYLEALGNNFCLEVLHSFEVELALDRGDLARARLLSRSVNFDGNNSIWYHYVVQLTPIRLMLAEGNLDGLMQSRTLLVQLDEKLLRMNRTYARIDVLNLLALVMDAEGDTSKAFGRLAEALQLGKSGGFIRNFVDLGYPMANLLQRLSGQGAGKEYAEYIEHILAAFSDEVRATQVFEAAPTSTGANPQKVQPIEPLTMRELQILKLLATDLSLQEIADQLAVSLGTLHVHNKNIYRKLDVHKRVEAIQLAKKLAIL